MTCTLIDEGCVQIKRRGEELKSQWAFSNGLDLDPTTTIQHASYNVDTSLDAYDLRSDNMKKKGRNYPFHMKIFLFCSNLFGLRF